MKITGIELIHVRPRWLFLKLKTDEGIIGYGEPILEGKARTVEMAVREFFEYLKGKDPRRIEHHWQAMYRWSFYRGGPIIMSAISGIEQALWDILGKYLGQPIYQLLGGAVRDKIKLYAGVGGETPEECVENAEKRIKEGFKAIKMAPFDATRIIDTPRKIKDAVEKVAAVRDAVGDDIDIGIDCHGRLSPSMAILAAKALEPYHPMFLEEPCLPENVDAMVRVARSTSIPIATGERLFTRWGFREVLEKQAASILQPDLCHAGGIFECRKIAAMAEIYYAAIAPHNPLGPIALAACLQLDACTPNFLIQEHATLGEGYLKRPFKIEDGYVRVPSEPGLGIELDEDAVMEKRYKGDWKNPQLLHEDGSVADW
ncbi:galactonate dehydratase [Candidatus Bathyarchaeota archaeon]|nr:galactonate dehydratase [Candidatus Bathyarchaeota archaeon]RLG94206.1 MAG: galactonate dehydratase [Candidatus Bathyarchaeota archaeon]